MGKFSSNIMANCFMSCAKYNPKGEVVIYGDKRITWGELTPRILRIGNALVKLGVKRGDKVAFMFHNVPEFIELNGGIQVAGAVPAPLNFRFIPKEVEYQGNHCDANVFIYDSLWAEAVEPAAPKLGAIKHFVCKGESNIDGVIDYEDFVASGEPTDPGVANDLEDEAVMIYTGGTTGFPKGVMLTYIGHVEMYSNTVANGLVQTLTMDIPKDRHKLIVEALPIPAAKYLAPILRTNWFKNRMRKPETLVKLKDTMRENFSDPAKAKKGYKRNRKFMYPSMPFFHDAAYANLMMGMLLGNMVYVLLPTVKFDPDLILGTVEKEQVDNMYNVPTGWKKLVSFEGRDQYDLTSIRMAGSGGGPCPAKLKKEIMGMFPNAMIMDAFGQTEMTPVTSIRFDFDADNLKDRSIGKSIVESKVVGEDGKEVAQGEIGEILYRSNTIMKGYYKDEEKTAESMADGWFKGGDLGYVDEDGEIRTVDRKKECINTGGEKVFPLEVEQVIELHPKVDDVCIIGVPDEEWGKTVRAVVVVKKGETMDAAEVKECCRGEIAGYKIPRTVVFVDELPFSPVGKMLRQKIRDLYGQPDEG